MVGEEGEQETCTVRERIKTLRKKRERMDPLKSNKSLHKLVGESGGWTSTPCYRGLQGQWECHETTPDNVKTGVSPYRKKIHKPRVDLITRIFRST